MRKYYLYHAAFHDCLSCVQFFIQHQKFDASERSETYRRNAVDWVKYGIELHKNGKAPAKSSEYGCENVLSYFDGMGLLAPDPQTLDGSAPSL